VQRKDTQANAQAGLNRLHAQTKVQALVLHAACSADVQDRQGTQTVDYACTLRAFSSKDNSVQHVLQVRVHLDSSYATQSSASVAVYSAQAQQFNVLHTLLGSVFAPACKSTYSADFSSADLQHVQADLLRVAYNVLGLL
jgi:hypothetical protein